MYHVRLTAPDGGSTVHNFRGGQCSVGREDSNDIVLTGNLVSSKHCVLELTATGVVLKELGSTNGTWLNGQRLGPHTALSEADQVWVGSFVLQVERAAPQSQAPGPAPSGPQGPILRTSSGADRAWRDLAGRFGRYAAQWERKGRPAELALSSSDLGRAQRWLKRATGDRKHEVTSSIRDFIAASEKVAKARAIKKVLLGLGGMVLLGSAVAAAIVLWPEPTPDEPDGATDTAAAATEDGEGGESSGGGFAQIDDDRADEEDVDLLTEVGDVNAPIEHTVIPFETLDDIARRYGVSVDQIAEWNYLNPDEPNLDQRKEPLKILEPTKRPLPQQKVDYQLEKGEASWTVLAERFDVPATRLEKYNADVGLKVGGTIAVWVDPKPYEPRENAGKVPEWNFGQDSVSVGDPTKDGRLRSGRQLPANPELYTRRAPYNMYGSSYTLKHLCEAIATFRRDVAYDGALILSDISQRSGGLFKPHKSHRAGRDIDIWLPTLKGVYKTKFIKSTGKERERRPLFAEVDWYALWGLVRALIKTGAVRYVFLDWRYQQFVYRAAANMGATQQELDDWIQWPQQRDSKAIFRHSKDHLSHIHVRFKCAPWERECKGQRGK